MGTNGNTRKRPVPPTPALATPSPQQKQRTSTEEEEFDEDVFLEETLLQYEEEDSQRRTISERLAKWKRPALSSSYLNQSQNIIFQQLEIDYVIGDSHKELLPNSSGPAAIIRIFGVTKEGHSVCCSVHGFEPYFYISCPPGMSPDDISHFHQALEGRMREANRNSKVPKFVRRIELVQRRSIMYYQQQSSQPFLKIVVALPTMVASCRGILDRGIQIDGVGMKSFMTYESNVLFALRFMIDRNIVGGNWIEVPVGKHKKTARNLSYSQLEFDCLFSDLISHAPEGGFSKMAPFRILSFDIECAGRKGLFPEPTHDPVIQVSNLVTLQGEDQPFVRNVMTLQSCAPIVGVDVMSFETEKEVLLAWRDFIREVDPDIIIGYNICKFDLPYLIQRAEVLRIAEFPILGRIRNSRVRVKDTTFSSRQLGTRESKEVTVEGRVQFDLLQVMQRDYKLSSYSLNSVSAHFLNEQKEDVHHSIISDLQNGNSETRRRLAVYCLKDAYLPQRLLDKLMFIYNYVEMARVTGVPISFLLSRGQSIKVLSQLLRKAKQKNLVIPNAKQAGSEQGTFEGATVLEARAGFYEKPIATLDFASLYPSIMMAYNLCYCTLVTPEDIRKLNLPPECVNRTPSGETFVKSNLQKGILPEILEELLAARKRAKADLKEAKDPLEKAVLDGRQLALKISANSVYGFTGATVGQLPCLEISSSVTSYGRQMIEHTKKLVEDKFTILGGYEHNAEIIYGDTDSVMVQFGVTSVEAAMNLGREAAEYISGTFIKPIKLEFEKVYYPYLLISKKRYAGLYWTNPNKFDKMDTKGIETVRRDNCLLVKNLVNECLHKILIERDIPGAVQYVKNTISDLLMNRMDLSLLVITKGLTKTGDDYEVKAAHVELAERMRKRDAATAPNVGDRVPYVIIKAAKGAKAYERSEDPIYVLEHNIPIDPHYYLRVIEANSVTVDADSDQHLLTASRGLSIHEFQKGSGLEHQAKTSLSSEAISPLSFDLFGGQQPMSFQQSSMLRSLQHQQSGINDMQQVQQEAFIKKMQELQRQQQLDLKQRNLFNQISPFAKQASGSQSSLNNDTPNSEASHYAWMVDHGNANWLHHASSGLAFNPNLGQTQRLADLVPQQVDQSLYGVPVSSSRGVAVNQYSQMGKDRSPMMQMSTNSNSLPGQYTGLQDQISVQGRALISGQRFQNEKIGHTSSQALSTGINMEILQQVNPMQRNTPQQDFWGRQELSVPQEASTEKPTKQVASSRNDGALDPMEEKILFGSDDNVWAALGKSNNMSDETVNLFDSGGLLDGVPSLQSGSWSALMQSAAAETSSSDMGLQDEWSGLIYNNAEVPSGNKHPSMYNNHGKQEVSLVGDNVRLPSTMSSGSAAPCDATNTNNQYQNFMGVNHFGPKFQGGPRQRLQPEKSQRPVSLEEEGKWSGSSSLQRVAEGSQMYRNASQPSLDVEKNAKSISTPLVHEHSGAGQLPNNCNNSSALSYGGDRVVNDREIGNLSQNSQSNPIKAIHEAADYRRSSWTLNSAPSSTVELGSPQVNKGGWSLNDAALVPNSVTTRVDEETSPFVQNNYLFQQQKNANSLVKSPRGDGLGRMLHQVNEGNKEEIARHETKNYDLMDNSHDSRQSNLSQHTSAGFMGRGMSDASDSQSLAPGKQKSITERGHKVSGTHKFQYHPMGNLDEDIEPSYGFKQPTHVQRMSSQNNDFELSKFLGQVPKNSIVVEKGQSSDLQIDGKNPDEGPSLENQSGYGRSVDTHTSNKASPSSQNMLDLLHKVDQSRDQGIVRHFDSSNGSGPSQLPEAENWDGLVGRLQNTQSSVSPGFGLQLGPPSQRIHKPDRLLSSQNAQHAFNSLHFSRTAGEIGEKDHNMASTPSVQSFPLSNEQSLVEFENNKSGSPRQYGTEASLYKIPANFSSALNSSFPYPGSHFQNQQITRTQGQRSQPIDLSSKNNASQSILKGSAEAFSPDVSGSVAHDNLASLEGMSQRTGTNDPRERGKAAIMSANDHVPASQPFSRSDIFQHGAAAQLLRNMWANVPTNKNTLGAPYHTVSSNFFQSPLPNIVESSTSIPLAQGDHDVRKERNFPSEFGAIPTNSRCVSGEEETLKERFNQQLGKSASINHLSDDSPANSASTQKDIEAFGQSLKPNSFSHQNFSLLNQKRAMKDAETDPNNRVSKKIKGPDNGLTVHQVALNTRQSNEHGTFLVDSLGSSTTVSSGDGGILSFSKPADFLESNISSQHGNIATKLGFGPDVSQSNYLSDTRVEQPHVSPQTAPSWFNQYGTFKNGQMPHTVTSFRTAEPSFPLSKSSGNFHALSLMEHGTTDAVNTCQVGRIFNSAPTSVATGPNKQKNDTSKLHPWHKEISQGSQNLQIHSLAAVEWAKAANCLTEKVEDDVEFIEDGPPIHRSKRRLVMTTQLMQRLFRPPSAAVFSADASLNYDSVAYSVSRMALGDACSAVSCSINSNMACNGINLLAAEGTPSSKNGDKHFAEVIEELMGRMKKLENEFLSLDNCSSILNLKVECQDLEKFSIINRFAKFHGRGQTDNMETTSMSDVMAGTQKTGPLRYVTALPMPRSVPDGVQCLSL